MPKYVPCPTCGAQATFRASSSLFAVCEYCKSTLVRQDLNITTLGKMADLLEDNSPLQLNAQGRYKGIGFRVIGRAQYQHESGIWNEWHVLFGNGKSGWLSEASGAYVLTFLAKKFTTQVDLNAFELGQSIVLMGQTFEVSNKEEAVCIAGEGELPFTIIPKQKLRTLDCTNFQSFASIDISETPPKLYLGEQVELHALNLSNLRPVETIARNNTVAKALQCPSCAGTISIESTVSKSVGCASCGALLDISNPQIEIIHKYRLATKTKPVIPLGSVGRFENQEFRAIGMLRRKAHGAAEWDEYLLHNPIAGFRWLTLSKGHWTFISPLQKSPTYHYGLNFEAGLNFGGKQYKHFESYTTHVSYVLGEFYWRIKLEDTAKIDEFIAPPEILSKETFAKETTWSHGTYLTPEEIAQAFNIATPLFTPQGVAPNQPSPYKAEASKYWVALFSFIFIGLLIQLGFSIGASNKQLINTPVALSQNYQNTNEHTTPSFKVEGRPTNLLIQQSANLNNDWLGTDVALIEKNTGQQYYASRDMSYYSGWDSDGSWIEDEHESEIIFSRVPAGEYYLAIKPYREFNKTDEISTQLVIYRDVPVWSNFFLLCLVLLIIPIIIFYLGYRFEVKRWQDSDHPISS